ncbi:hypothetical protein CYMTET_34812, partial [Cymbomonas tetramitiformis]
GGVALGFLSRLMVTSSSMNHNQAATGGAVHALGAHVLFDSGSHMASNCATQLGGGVNGEQGTTVVLDRGALLTNNTASLLHGGGVALERSQLLVDRRAAIAGNQAARNGGGVFAFDGSSVVLRGSAVVQHNAAGNGGGGLNMDLGSWLRVEAGGNVTQNSATSGGGVHVDNEAGVTIDDAGRIAGNEASLQGGGIFAARESYVRVNNRSLVVNNSAGGAGGGIATEGGVAVFVTNESSLAHNRAQTGGGISSGSGRVMVAGSEVLYNVAEEGAGLSCRDDSSLQVQGSTVSYNYAEGAGGGVQAVHLNVTNASVISHNRAAVGAGIHSTSGATVALGERSIVAGNAASLRGAGVYLEGVPAVVRIWDVDFVENSVSAGGGSAGALCIGRPANHSSISLRGLTLRDNVAPFGGNILWEIRSGEETVPPQCEACTHAPNSTALFVTNAVTGAVFQPHASGALVRVDTLSVMSNEAIEPYIVYQALDFYGNVVMIDTSLYDGCNTSLVYAIPFDELEVRGESIATYASEDGERSAVFRDLRVKGVPGRHYQLSFQHFLADNVQALVDVDIAPCVVGDLYLSEPQLCTDCDQGTIKLFLGSTECYPCSDAHGAPIPGIVCLGGSTFYIEQGYYLSPNAQHCQEEECFLDRVYACPTKAACTTEPLCSGAECGTWQMSFAQASVTLGDEFDQRRGGHAVADAAAVQLCARGPYADSVLCGGGILPVCGDGYHLSPSSQSCTRCPSEGAVLSQVVIIVIMALVVMLVLVVLFSCNPPERDLDSADDSVKLVRALADAKGAVSLLVGYFQVMSQLSFIFGTHLVHKVLAAMFGNLFAIFKLDSSALLDIECMLHHFPVMSSSSPRAPRTAGYRAVPDAARASEVHSGNPPPFF